MFVTSCVIVENPKHFWTYFKSYLSNYSSDGSIALLNWSHSNL